MPSARRRALLRPARAAAWVFAVSLATGAVIACTETRRPLGEDCLKSEDCLSGVCSGLKCVTLPPLLDGAPTRPPDASTLDAGVDASDAASTGDSATSDAADEG